jgi:hypothetical protein
MLKKICIIASIVSTIVATATIANSDVVSSVALEISSRNFNIIKIRSKERDIQNSDDLNSEVGVLLRGAEPDDLMKAAVIGNLCAEAHAKQTALDDFWQHSHEAFKIESSLSSETFDQLLKVIHKTVKRCGGEFGISATAMPNTVGVADRANALGSKLAIALKLKALDSSKNLDAPQETALNQVLANNDLSAIWFVDSAMVLSVIAAHNGYFDGLNVAEQQALVWLTICKAGVECNGDGFGRIRACLHAYLCNGESVVEAVAASISPDKTPSLRRRADKFNAQLYAEGASMFRLKTKVDLQ